MIPAHLKGRDFLRINDWAPEELVLVLDHADRLKARQRERVPHLLLEGRTLGMIFQKPSTRTRVSFEVGISQLGGTGLYLAAGDLQLGRGETIKDTAMVLSRYLDGIMIRTFEQADVDELAEHADIPVINGLTDEFHPCQAIADVMTIREQLAGFDGVRVAYLTRLGHPVVPRTDSVLQDGDRVFVVVEAARRRAAVDVATAGAEAT